MFRQEIKNLAHIAYSLGVRHVVIAPGSRSTPLTLAFTAQDGVLCYPVTDERSAAFFALGIAQYSNEPVAVVCTSGTAVLNFAPAVAEAYYQHLPLIVFTADRPAAWIDQADGQTIRQQNIFGNYIKASFQLPTDVEGISTWQSDRTVAQAIDMAVQFPRGPVHMNVPLDEPLYVALPEKHSNPRVIRSLATEIHPDKQTSDLFIDSWNKASKRMILVGIGRQNKQLNAMLETIARETETLVVAENLSNISGKNIVTNPDVFFAALSEDEKMQLQPELLITIGHSIISKQLRQYLRKYKAKEQWQLQSEMPYADTYQSLNYILPVKAEKLLGLLIDNESINLPGLWFKDEAQSYRNLCSAIHQRSTGRAAAYFNTLPLSDIALIRKLLPQIPSGWVLQIANSTPIRISQLFDTRDDLEYFSNRGTSGIEGSVSTAAGSAVASAKPTLLISGDLSFLYDSNGLWNSNFPANLKILLLNNGGANIFSMIGNKEVTEHAQEFFHASHHVDIAKITAAHGLKHILCSKIDELPTQIVNFLQFAGPAVLEVTTDKDINVSTYKELFKHIR
jgi:2-succinyl-5-enolpyruvyl-6-hydroxy-3-cyclohexene-1-carboxylate synthase